MYLSFHYQLLTGNREMSSHPKKLVRGQDIWLGKGHEQTKQILKCMWCGASFKTLAELTQHMQETQHYTKVISQEQITSWKNQAASSASLASDPGISPPTTPLPLPPTYSSSSTKETVAQTPQKPQFNKKAQVIPSHVSAVLSCKVRIRWTQMAKIMVS